MSTLIVNAQLVNEGQVWQADVLLDQGRIARIDADLQHLPAQQVIDAKGQYLLPGVIDTQVHFREPGLTAKGNIASESAAAVRGGTTSFIDMPNVNPPTLDAEALRHKKAIAANTSYANYGFYLGASLDNLEHIKAITRQDACGIKVFMGASTGDMLVDHPEVLEAIFANAPLLVSTHCEYSPRINERMAQALAKYGPEIPAELHPWIRDHQACLASSSLAVDLAKRHGTQLHVLHLTTKDEMALFSDLPLAQKQITAEACVHHLWFSDRDYAHKGHLIKCNPAIKTQADQDALWQALHQGRIDLIATDHAPHLLSEKQAPYGKAAAGLPLVQHSLMMMLEQVERGRLTLAQLVHWMCHQPAERFAIRERGYLREGYFADLVLIAAQDYQVRPDNIAYHCGWSPLQGQNFRWQPSHTWVNGDLAYARGELLARPRVLAL